MYFFLNCVSAGTLISHEKLLLQINTEREMGNMDYKLGQVEHGQRWITGILRNNMLD